MATPPHATLRTLGLAHRTTKGAESSSQLILAELATVTGAIRCNCYYLNHLAATLRFFTSSSVAHKGTDLRLPASFDAIDPHDTPLYNFLRSEGGDRLRGSTLLSIRTDSTLVGLVEFVQATEPPDGSSPEVDALSSALVVSLSARSVDHLLSAIQQPIEFRVPPPTFYQDTIDLAALAVEMEMAALRELSGDELLCTALSGFGSTEKSSFDLDLCDVPLFETVVRDKQPQFEPSLRTAPVERVGVLKSREPLEAVEAFIVVPVLVGYEVFGVLSFASRISTTFSELDIGAFLSVANAVGVSISNYRSFHAGASDVGKWNQVAVSITAIEIAQSARHEAKIVLGNVRGQLDLLRGDVGTKNQALVERVDKIETQVESILMALDKIRAATKPPVRVLESAPIARVWNEAVTQISARLQTLNIATRFDGSTAIEAELYVDWFRQVFLNLLLNSADAFEAQSKRRGREVRLQVREISGKEPRLLLRYNDNAGGIHSQALTFPPAYRGPREPEQAVFEPDVTSKVDGSGWGMFLVRKILGDHKGSIDLVSRRGGVTFDIDLPQAQPK